MSYPAKRIIIVIALLIFVFSIMPIGFLNANPGEIVINGDFQTGTANPWSGIDAIIDNDGSGNYFLNAQGS